MSAEALHNLCRVAVDRGDSKIASEYGAKAFAAYGPKHQNVPALASDLAWLWLTQDGAFSQALTVFENLLRHFKEPIRRLFIMANIARAAGGAGRRDTFSWAASAVWDMLHLIPSGEGHAAALLDVTHGALSLSRLAEADFAAGRSLILARERGESRLVLAAESLREAIQNYRAVERLPAPSPSPVQDQLATDLVRALVASH